MEQVVLLGDLPQEKAWPTLLTSCNISSERGSNSQKCPVFILQDCLTNNHKPSGWQQHKFMLSQLWSPEVQSQGVSRVIWRLWGRSVSHLCASFGQLPATLGAAASGCLALAFVSCKACRAMLFQDDLISRFLPWLCLQRSFFQIRLQSQVFGKRLSRIHNATRHSGEWKALLANYIRHSEALLRSLFQGMGLKNTLGVLDEISSYVDSEC